MTLIGFHKTLITAAILFCGGFSVWEFAAYSESGRSGDLTLAVVFVALAIGLVYYLINLRRFLDGRAN